MTPSKKCTKCGKDKELSLYRKMHSGKSGRSAQCRKCESDHKKRRRHTLDGITAQRREWLKRKFNLTVEDYMSMYDAQGGVCAICYKVCKSGRSLAVDHDHDTGKIRGLLCASCNTGIGLLVNVDNLLRAMAYLSSDIIQQKAR